MKFPTLLIAAFAWAAAGALQAAPAPSQTQVIFDHPDKFRDIKDSFNPTDKGEQAILDEIQHYLVAESRIFVPADMKLTMTFTDIDLAGDFEPEHGPSFDDIRIIKSIYPPHFKFTWSVADSSGQVVRQGSEDILDMSYQMRITINTSDPLRYEKDILSEWMRSKLGDLKKKSSS